MISSKLFLLNNFDPFRLFSYSIIYYVKVAFFFASNIKLNSEYNL